MAAAAAAPGAEGPGPGPGRAPEEELPPLEPAEARSRLERSARQFRNRRKVLIRGLPPDVSNQEVHELLSDYELKYCFVDKYKGTAFVTLLNGEQAESAIRKFHLSKLRDRELSVQLQPTDALLCIANLPRLYSQQQFEELVRPFGNLERCFLVYSEKTGHSKGYGFVEYMKKDSAARAKSDLLGRQLGTRALYVHWTDGAQLTLELVHSRCLCVDKLPHNYADLEELRGVFSALCPPTFCQLAYGQDGQLKGFAVLEYESAEAAEMVQQATDGLLLAGNHVRVSFCAPGPPGRSMLAALIAAQATALNRGKGLLPEPNILQILNSLGNPASLQLLLNPLLHGAVGGKQGILGAAPSMPLVANPALSTALLQLALQNQPQAQQKPGILGDSPLGSLPHGALALAAAPAQPPGQLLGELSAGGPLPGDMAQGRVKSPILPSGNVALAPFLGPVGAERDGSVLGGGAPPGLPARLRHRRPPETKAGRERASGLRGLAAGGAPQRLQDPPQPLPEPAEPPAAEQPRRRRQQSLRPKSRGAGQRPHRPPLPVLPRRPPAPLPGAGGRGLRLRLPAGFGLADLPPEPGTRRAPPGQLRARPTQALLHGVPRLRAGRPGGAAAAPLLLRVPQFLLHQRPPSRPEAEPPRQARRDAAGGLLRRRPARPPLAQLPCQDPRPEARLLPPAAVAGAQPRGLLRGAALAGAGGALRRLLPEAQEDFLSPPPRPPTEALFSPPPTCKSCTNQLFFFFLRPFSFFFPFF